MSIDMLLRASVIILCLIVALACGDTNESAGASEAGSYAVVITSVDPDRKIQSIKAVREATGLGLADAKHLVEDLPSRVKAGLTHAEAAALKQDLETLGMSAEMQGP